MGHMTQDTLPYGQFFTADKVLDIFY